MKTKFIAAIAALLLLPAPAFTQALTPGGASSSASASSWVAGGQVGYNWQQGLWVYGIEADLSGMHLDTNFNTVIPLTLATATANAHSNVDWYGTVRGRLGWSSGPILFYGTAGLAYGHVDLNSSISSPAGPVSLSSQTSATRAGWVVGGGIDYMWSPNLILNLGYQYVDLGTINLSGVNTAFGGVLSQTASTHAQFSVFTVGLNWRFSPGSMRPAGAWEGLYAGGHVGGAWGNDTTASYFVQPPLPPSDARLKRDVTLLARGDDGLGIYRYRYLWSDTVYVGVMAQEVAFVHPDAVVQGPDGYLRVNYSRLGLKLMTLPEWDAFNTRL